MTRTQAWADEIDRAVEPHRVAMRDVLADFDSSERAVIARHLQEMTTVLAPDDR